MTNGSRRILYPMSSGRWLLFLHNMSKDPDVLHLTPTIWLPYLLYRTYKCTTPLISSLFLFTPFVASFDFRYLRIVLLRVMGLLLCFCFTFKYVPHALPLVLSCVVISSNREIQKPLRVKPLNAL